MNKTVGGQPTRSITPKRNCSEEELSDRRSSSSSDSRRMNDSAKKPRNNRNNKKKRWRDDHDVLDDRLSASDSDEDWDEKLADDSSSDSDPVWSPHSSKVVFFFCFLSAIQLTITKFFIPGQWFIYHTCEKEDEQSNSCESEPSSA